MQTRNRNPFTTIHTEGALLPSDLLQRVLENDKSLAGLTPENHELAIAIAATPEHIRGFGHIKEAHIASAKSEEAALLRAFRDPNAPKALAAQ